jgi:hypothetical protein
VTQLFKLQFLGPLALFVALPHTPLNTRRVPRFFGFINLRMFGIFQRSDAQLSYVTLNYVTIDGFQLFGIALPIFALAVRRV